MKIENLQVAEYKNCPILVRRMGNIFEYFAIYKGKFYHAHNIITLPFFRRIFGGTYTPKEREEATRIVLLQAQTTIDFLLDPNKK